MKISAPSVRAEGYHFGKFLTGCWLALGLLFVAKPQSGQADDGIQLIPAGTMASPRPPEGWSDIVFVSTPKVSEGDVDQVPNSVLSYAELLHFVVLADVQSVNKSGMQQFQLAKIGVGLAVQRGGSLVVAHTTKPRPTCTEPSECHRMTPLAGRSTSRGASLPLSLAQTGQRS